MKLTQKLLLYLNDLENRIDADQEELILQKWREFADAKTLNGPFIPPARKPSPAGVEWPEINANDTLEDEELMILGELAYCSWILSGDSGLLMKLRPNYGVGTVPSFFGAERFLMPREMNILPNVRNIPGGLDAMRRLTQMPMPSLSDGVGSRVFSVGEAFLEIRDKFPKFGAFVQFEHPDFQGPFDICELLWGSEIFVELYDEPELVHALLRRVTDFYKIIMEAWQNIKLNGNNNYNTFYGRMFKGKITLRDDSAINLSPDFYAEFMQPYDEELLLHFGGGAIHFCGKGDHFIGAMSRTKGLEGIEMSQPHLNDMDIILANTADKGIRLIVMDDPRFHDGTMVGHSYEKVYVY